MYISTIFIALTFLKKEYYFPNSITGPSGETGYIYPRRIGKTYVAGSDLAMVNIFNYVDFHQYLKEWFEEKKIANPNYSYQVFSQKAGISNRGFVYNIIKGQKHLSPQNCAKFSRAMQHKSYETEYFLAIVAFCQSKTLEERNQQYAKFSHLKNKNKGFTPSQILRNDQYEYYSKWYYSAVRSLIDMYEFREDYRWLARMVKPHISVPQARQSIRLLERLNLISRDADGRYHICDKGITSGIDISRLAISNFHIDCTRLAEVAIRDLPREERNVTGLTLGISRASYELICARVSEVQDEIIQIAHNDLDADRVFQFNFHLFPLSGNDPDTKRQS
jgi:uncharacterized protein (TIGR02147 family)